MNPLVLVCFLYLHLAASLPLEARGGCQDVTFSVSGSAQNRELRGISLTNSTELLATLMDDAFTLIPVEGTQNLAGTYCPASVENENNSKLQVLFHGITANRGYWSALGGLGVDYPEYEPSNYSWVDVANARGYPTLAMDRLGAGESSHPDPVLVVQGPYEYVSFQVAKCVLMCSDTLSTMI